MKLTKEEKDQLINNTVLFEARPELLSETFKEIEKLMSESFNKGYDKGYSDTIVEL